MTEEEVYRLQKKEFFSRPAGNLKIYELLQIRWGRTPMFSRPAELLALFRQYCAWTDDNPEMVTEAVKSGNAAGTLYSYPRKHLRTENEFTSFMGASGDYLTEMRKKYVRDYEEFGLDVSKEFYETIDKIRLEIRDDQDRGAASDKFNAQYIMRLRGLVDKKDITSDGKEVQGGLNVTVLEPNNTKQVARLKEFKKKKQDEENATGQKSTNL